jgi:hypothetical protein
MSPSISEAMRVAFESRYGLSSRGGGLGAPSPEPPLSIFQLHHESGGVRRRGLGAEMVHELNPFPILTIAVLCESVSDKGPSVQLDGIRTLWTAAPGQSQMNARYYIEFLSNGFVGDLDLIMRMVTPDARGEEIHDELHFEEGMFGVRNTGPMDLNLQVSGLYWLDIVLGGRFMTRIPIALQSSADSDIHGGLPLIPGDHEGPYVSIASFVYWSEARLPDRLSIVRVPPVVPVTMNEAGHIDDGKQHLTAQFAGWIRLIPGAMPEGAHVARFTWAFPDGEVSPTEEVEFKTGFPALPCDLRFTAEVDFGKPGPYELRVEIEDLRLALPMELRPGPR